MILKAIADISKNIWTFNEKPLSSYFLDLEIGFRDNENLPVFFDRLSFGYSMVLNDQIIFEKELPPPGCVYESTDQEKIEGSYISVIPGKQYTLNFWANNSDIQWNDFFSFFLPVPDSPYPSWILNPDEGLWVPPYPYPTDGKNYIWDEEKLLWVSEEELS